MLNQIVLVGRITQDPKVTELDNGKKICNVTVANLEVTKMKMANMILILLNVLCGLVLLKIQVNIVSKEI